MGKQKNITKRDFLKLSATGLAGAFLAQHISAIQTKVISEAKPEDKAKPVERMLGKTGISLPVISSGSFIVDNPNLARAVMRSGVKYLDSAWLYNNGKNDELLGKLLKEFGREKYIISNKVLMPSDNTTGLFTKEATTKAFLEQLDVSLKRLGSDYVDLLYLHRPANREAAMNEEMLNGLRIAKEQGKARFIGYSQHSNQAEIIDCAIESKICDIVLLSYNFRQDHIVKPAIEKAAKAGIGIVGMKTFAGEYDDKDRNKPVNRQAALKWVLQDQNVGTVLVSFKTYEDISQLVPVMYDIKITEAEEKDLQASYNRTGIYCLGCEKCRQQCPGNLHIPDLMRAYMYAYGYRNLSKAQDVIAQHNLSDNPCGNCSTCNVNCTAGFNVKEKIADIIRLNKVPKEFLV